MPRPMRPDEIRIVIRPADEPGNSVRPIPAKVFRRAFNTFFEALKAADTELHSRKRRSEFFVAHLGMGSNEVGLFEQTRAFTAGSPSPSIDFFKQCAMAVYRSDYSRVVEVPKLAKRIIDIADSVDVHYPYVAYFPDNEMVPIDEFFVKQVDRLKSAIGKTDAAPSRYFAGSAIGAFDGRLENIDYRGAVWKGHLVLAGGSAQVECVFDRSKGEDEYNQYGNKRVSITGRAIYTGDSQLPERVEVHLIEEFPLAEEHIDIRGSLSDARISRWGEA